MTTKEKRMKKKRNRKRKRKTTPLLRSTKQRYTIPHVVSLSQHIQTHR